MSNTEALPLEWRQAKTEGVWLGTTGEPGPIVGIAGGVHGNETAGIDVVNDLRTNLMLDRGGVVLIHGNPRAIEKNVRFTEVNLNRSFRELTVEEQEQDFSTLPYEVQRGQELLPYLDRCYALLDLHEMLTDAPEPFIICEPNATETARHIGAATISFGWSQSEPGGSDAYMFNAGKEGLCYELGLLSDPEPNITLGHAAVARFLQAHGLVDSDLPPLHDDPSFVQTKYAFIRTEEEFALARKFHSFESLETDELIATQAGEEVRAAENDVIIFPNPVAPLNTEAFTIGQIIEV